MFEPLPEQGILDLKSKDSRLLELSEEIRTTAPTTIHFLHTVLCQVGLPRRRTENLTFERKSGNASLLITAGRMYDGNAFQQQFIPYGSRPRLALVHICTEAARTRSAIIPIGKSLRNFLTRLRMDTNGRSFAVMREQMNALSACQIQLGYGRKNVSARLIDQYDAWLSNDKSGSESEIQLSPRFYESIIDASVPLDPRAIAGLKGSSLALDIYTWLAHRLWRVRDPNGDIIFWANLREQFGQEYVGEDPAKDFKKKFLSAMRLVQNFYPEARIERNENMFRLLPSPPPVPRTKTMVDFGRVLKGEQ